MEPDLDHSTSDPFVKHLNSLRNRERSWRSITWKRHYRLHLPSLAHIYEFVGGIYGNRREGGKSEPILAISFFELPSSGCDPGVEYRMWTHAFGNICILDFTIDPSQDLLVLVTRVPAESKFTFEVHLRTLSANDPYPKAASPVLPCFPKDLVSMPLSNSICTICVQISGDLVGFLMKEMDAIEVWHPASGFCVSPVSSLSFLSSQLRKSSFVLPSGIDDFIFLSQTSFLIICPLGYLEIYHFYTLMDSSPPPVLLGSFSFPPLSEGFSFWHCSLSGNPSPGCIPHTSQPGVNSNVINSVHHLSLVDHVLVCCMYILEPTPDPARHRVHSFIFFFHANLFFEENPHSILASWPHNPTPTNMTPVEWDAWGPANTRCFWEHLTTDWQHELHGMHTAEKVPSGPEDSAVSMHRYLRIRDFNPFVVHKGKVLWDESDNSHWQWRQVIKETTTTQVEGAFKKNIESSLPYTEVVSRQAFDMTDVMMDDCRILILK
ncbi:hypothetical protein EV421DRAFT_1927589, partial [Armillaria borealis]